MTFTVAIDYRMCRSSGIGVYLRNVVPRLVRDHGKEFRCILIGGEAVEGAEFVACAAPIYSLRELVELPVRAPRSADIFWSPSYVAPLRSHGRLVVTVHDVNHLALPHLIQSRLKRAYARLMFANVRRRADRVICDSRFTATELTRLVGVESSRIDVIHCGIDDDWRAPSPAARLLNGPYVLSVGNVKPHKNLGRLLRAFAMLRDRIPHTLVVVGKRDGLITPDHELATAADALGSRVHFTGEVSHDTLRAWYGHADLLVHPSLYEGFGFPPLEAMASGVPVAASNAASIPEVCGDAAAYFDPMSVENMAAVIETALTDQRLRASLRETGRRQVAQYQWDTTVARIASVFRAVAAR